jgi:NDP-sugar pyrophosphorylase family protein
MLGKSLVEYWVEHLAGLGATHINILCAERSGVIRKIVGDGARWGLRAEVTIEPRELAPGLARTKYPVLQKNEWLPQPNDMVSMLHFPGQPQLPLFNSYAGWFEALMAWMPVSSGTNRIGLREIRPGVWVGARAHIAPDATLRAPCWIGEDATIGARSVIGPMTVVEARSWVEPDCEIAASYVGGETMVGRFSELKDSIAIGSTLVNCKTASVATVADPFVLCALGSSFPRLETARWRQRLSALFARTEEDVDLVLKLP